MENNKWKLVVHEGHQIADTGDYSDGHTELTNGDISMVTKEEIGEIEEDMLLSALNGYDTKWEDWEKDDIKYGYGLEKGETKRLYDEVEKWKELCDQIYSALMAVTNGNAEKTYGTWYKKLKEKS